VLGLALGLGISVAVWD